jgi:hypothetical protein
MALAIDDEDMASAGHAVLAVSGDILKHATSLRIYRNNRVQLHGTLSGPHRGGFSPAGNDMSLSAGMRIVRMSNAQIAVTIAITKWPIFHPFCGGTVPAGWSRGLTGRETPAPIDDRQEALTSMFSICSIPIDEDGTNAMYIEDVTRHIAGAYAVTISGEVLALLAGNDRLPAELLVDMRWPILAPIIHAKVIDGAIEEDGAVLVTPEDVEGHFADREADEAAAQIEIEGRWFSGAPGDDVPW